MFHHILVPGFGGDSASVLKILTKLEKWEELDGAGGLQRNFLYHAALVNSQLSAYILSLKDPEPRGFLSPCIKFTFTFLMGLSDFITHSLLSVILGQCI